ncbi:MAG: ABC transporter substrate-binding protein [Bacteroidetes bacterium]|nr:MAG: ABC transporter substrate-binding protein [Bacteroidota bacterium]
MKNTFLLLFVFATLIIFSCKERSQRNIPSIGFLDLLQDETLEQARKGFFVALDEEGFNPMHKTIEVIYRNAQNDQATLVQACDYLISQRVDLIASNPTLSTITAVQRTGDIPVFMMVSPRPDIARLTDKKGYAPANLFGVYETLEYIDTSVLLIKNIFPKIKKIGTIYNQSEPQSMDALERIESMCLSLGIELVKLPVNSSNETQLVVAALLNKNIEAFFALPDNTVFSSMEVIVKLCDKEKIPVFSSEEGLVKRGALVAFGADMYQWGYQSGRQAAQFLKTKSLKNIQPELVKVRRRVYNSQKAELFGVQFDSTFVKVN